MKPKWKREAQKARRKAFMPSAGSQAAFEAALAYYLYVEERMYRDNPLFGPIALKQEP